MALFLAPKWLIPGDLRGVIVRSAPCCLVQASILHIICMVVRGVSHVWMQRKREAETLMSTYDATYFAQQMSEAGEIAGASAFLFQPHITANDTVVDFGCGGGAL